MPVSMISDMHPHLNTHTFMPINRAARTNTGGMSQERPDSAHLSGLNTGWHQRGQVNSAWNATAGQVRAIDARLQVIERHINKMTGDIRAFEKNFPPFPRGSEERVRLLNSFSAIRKQIERLTMPPEKEMMSTIMNGVTSQPDSSTNMVERFEQLLQSVETLFPNDPDEPSDTAFKELGEKLQTLLEFISQKRTELVEQAGPRKYFQEKDTVDILQIETVSITIKQAFSDQTDWQMTVSQTQLMALQV